MTLTTVIALVRTMRPPQWVKNLFVAAPALFAKEHTAKAPWLVLDAILGTAVFILISGAVYVMNDVLDVEKDRLHPVRSRRPIASGAISVQAAVAGGLLALAIAFVAGAALGQAFVAMATGYLVLNIFYSSVFKKVAWLDVLAIATGFLLRILAGCFAIGLAPGEISYYLLLCTFLVALFLAVGKRRHELAVIGSADQRAVLGQYTIGHLDLALYVVGGATVVAYTLYTLSERTKTYFGTWRLVFTVPFVLVGIVRYIVLVRRSDEKQSPTDMMIRDVPFVVNLLVWGAVVVFVIYG